MSHLKETEYTRDETERIKNLKGMDRYMDALLSITSKIMFCHSTILWSVKHGLRYLLVRHVILASALNTLLLISTYKGDHFVPIISYRNNHYFTEIMNSRVFFFV